MGARPELSALTTADGGVLRFAPFSVGGEQWLKFAEQSRGATPCHRRPWLDLLRAHGINIQVATLEYGAAPVAGCLFAGPARPFARRLISLPDSECCGPLDGPNGANHLMFVSAMDEFAGRVRHWDLGRVGIRNCGLRGFKKRLGATSTPLPYAFFHARRATSARRRSAVRARSCRERGDGCLGGQPTFSEQWYTDSSYE